LISCRQGNTNVKAGNFVQDTTEINTLIHTAGTFSQNKPDSQFLLLSTALQRSTAIHFVEGIAKTKTGLVDYYKKKGEYVEAVAHSLSVINLFDSLHLTEKKIDAQLLLSVIYKEMGAERGTIDYLNSGYALAREAEQSAVKENIVEGIANSLNNQGIILRDMSYILKKPALMVVLQQEYPQGYVVTWC
jgi:hypothetical protein